MGWTFTDTAGRSIIRDGEALSPGEVVCPDCKQGTISPRDRCSVCSLSYEDLEAAAAFLERS